MDAKAVLAPVPLDRERLRPGRLSRVDGRDGSAGWSLELTEPERGVLAQDLASLTDREREVVFAICAGGQNQAIADRLFIALPTLRTHLMRINQKLGARSKGDVIRFVVSRLLTGYRSGALRVEGWEAGGVVGDLLGSDEGVGPENHRKR